MKGPHIGVGILWVVLGGGAIAVCNMASLHMKNHLTYLQLASYRLIAKMATHNIIVYRRLLRPSVSLTADTITIQTYTGVYIPIENKHKHLTQHVH